MTSRDIDALYAGKQFAFGMTITTPRGRQFWIPNRGRPFWSDCASTPDLSDDELEEFGVRKVREEPGRRWDSDKFGWVPTSEPVFR